MFRSLRRGFGRLTLPLAGCAVLSLTACSRPAEEPVAAAAPAPAQAAACKLGVQLYSFRHDLGKDLPGTLARVKQLGIDCIEPYSLHGRSAEELRAEFDRAGLQVVSLHLPRELFLGPPEETVRIAKTLGAQQIGVAWVKETQTDVVDEPKLMAAAQRLNAMCPAAQAAGLRVFYHPHGYEFHEGDPDGQMFDRFVNALQRDCVSLQLDAYWVAYAGQDANVLLQRYADRTLSLHVKDMPASQPVAPFDGSKWQGPLPDEAFAVIGQGKLDWPRLIETAKASAVRWYIIEDETTTPYDSIAAAMPFLKAQGL